MLMAAWNVQMATASHPSLSHVTRKYVIVDRGRPGRCGLLAHIRAMEEHRFFIPKYYLGIGIFRDKDIL